MYDLSTKVAYGTQMYNIWAFCFLGLINLFADGSQVSDIGPLGPLVSRFLLIVHVFIVWIYNMQCLFTIHLSWQFSCLYVEMFISDCRIKDLLHQWLFFISFSNIKEENGKKKIRCIQERCSHSYLSIVCCSSFLFWMRRIATFRNH